MGSKMIGYPRTSYSWYVGYLHFIFTFFVALLYLYFLWLYCFHTIYVLQCYNSINSCRSNYFSVSWLIVHQFHPAIFVSSGDCGQHPWEHLHTRCDNRYTIIILTGISLGPCAMWDICQKCILNSNPTKSRSSITSTSIVQSVWNFAQSTAVILPCSV